MIRLISEIKRLSDIVNTFEQMDKSSGLKPHDYKIYKKYLIELQKKQRELNIILQKEKVPCLTPNM
ncbi:MAG: hypothetical protein J6J17_02195 [Bacilli bacterium]|nr:hypothetical protein [Bacilli bacterium]